MTPGIHKLEALIGHVCENTAYYHGEHGLSMAITGMAQNFLGSNNVNLLVPHGHFGCRHFGNKESGASQYLSFALSSITSTRSLGPGAQPKPSCAVPVAATQLDAGRGSCRSGGLGEDYWRTSSKLAAILLHGAPEDFRTPGRARTGLAGGHYGPAKIRSTRRSGHLQHPPLGEPRPSAFTLKRCANIARVQYSRVFLGPGHRN